MTQEAETKAPETPAVNTPPENVTEVQWHFAVPVYTKIIGGHNEHQNPLMELMEDLQQEQPEGLLRSNLNAWHSHNNLHLNTNEHIQWLNREVGVMAKDCISSRNPEWEEFDILMDSCWANIAGIHGWNAPHNHYPSQWSGVYYVSVEDVLNMEDRDDKGGKIDFFNPIPISAAFGLPSSVTYTPRNGLMILFPALLQHMVHPNLRDANRYTIAFNLNAIPKSLKAQ